MNKIRRIIEMGVLSCGANIGASLQSNPNANLSVQIIGLILMYTCGSALLIKYAKAIGYYEDSPSKSSN